MEQLHLFGEAGQTPGLPSDLLEYHPGIITTAESNDFLMDLSKTVPWEQKIVNMYGKEMIALRLTAWYGDPEKNYAYTGNHFTALPWTVPLLQIRQLIAPFIRLTFNSVLLNYCRNGNDAVAWHSDNEQELGKQPLIASISLCQVRRFDIRHKQHHERKYPINLEDGSLLLMKGDLQRNWEHRIAKANKPMRQRVNLTFRIIE